jgi:hypothetical protein
MHYGAKRVFKRKENSYTAFEILMLKKYLNIYKE